MSSEQREKLIECVKNHEEIYNTSHENYKMTKLKDDLWAQIALECGLKNGECAKGLWKKLRDSHREALKRQVTKSGQANKYVKKWQYQDQMEFLKQFTAHSPTSTNISETQNAIPESESHPESFDIEDDTVSSNPCKKFKKQQNNEMLHILKENLLQRKERTNFRTALLEKQTNVKNPSLYNFFMSMYETCVDFPKSYQVDIKRKVFDTVMNYEKICIPDSPPESMSVHDLEEIFLDETFPGSSAYENIQGPGSQIKIISNEAIDSSNFL